MGEQARKFRLGLVVNPYAGIGGAVALKGSDGAEIRQRALAMGAQKLANQKTEVALTQLLPQRDRLVVKTAAGEMGEQIATKLGFDTQVVYRPTQPQTEACDTVATVSALRGEVDLLLFAGGDGTARDICDVLGQHTPALGIPAGCKIHSGVYGITPRASGAVVAQLVDGELVSLHEAEVRDIDEVKFRQGKVLSRHFGEMRVPAELQYVQAVKMGGKESDELVLSDIAAEVMEQMQDHPECLYIMGSGSTVDSIMQELGLPNTLLGVDVVQNHQLIASDVSAMQLIELIQQQPAKIVMTAIGGQGHILGRGNQQLSPAVIRTVGRENLMIVASKTKLQSITGGCFKVDSGDAELDQQLVGPIPVITGFHDHVLFPVKSGAA